MGLTEWPTFFFAVGLAHYMVLFVTLYQRLPTNETLPKELHPVFFLVVATPNVASMAWEKLQGSFNYRSLIAYFIALFLYFSLVSISKTKTNSHLFGLIFQKLPINYNWFSNSIFFFSLIL